MTRCPIDRGFGRPSIRTAGSFIGSHCNGPQLAAFCPWACSMTIKMIVMMAQEISKVGINWKTERTMAEESPPRGWPKNNVAALAMT